MTNYREAK